MVLKQQSVQYTEQLLMHKLLRYSPIMHLPIPLLEAQYLIVYSHIKGRSGVQIVDLEYLANMLSRTKLNRNICGIGVSSQEKD